MRYKAGFEQQKVVGKAGGVGMKGNDCTRRKERKKATEKKLTVCAEKAIKVNYRPFLTL